MGVLDGVAVGLIAFDVGEDHVVVAVDEGGGFDQGLEEDGELGGESLVLFGEEDLADFEFVGAWVGAGVPSEFLRW